MYVSAHLIYEWLPSYTEEAEIILTLESESSLTLHRAITIILMWITVLISGALTCLWRTVRQRLAFFYLAHRTHCHLWCEYQLRNQKRMKQNLVPKSLNPEVNYAANHLSSIDNTETKIRGQMGIFYAQVVGLEKVLKEKTVPESGKIIHNIILTLDNYCLQMGCEKVHAMNSRYMAVSVGYHENELGHVRSCIDFGLFTCHAIKRMSVHLRANLRLRVAVHYGMVAYALMGIRKPRFEIYSGDVEFTKTLLKLGYDGRVCVSDSAYSFSLEHFRFAQGKSVVTRQQGQRGPVTRSTYVVDPRSENVFARFEMQPKMVQLTGDSSAFLSTLSAMLFEAVQEQVTIANCHPQNERHRILNPNLCGDTHLRSNKLNRNQLQQQEHLRLSIQYFVGNIERAPKPFHIDYESPPINYWTMRFLESDEGRQHGSQSTNYKSIYVLDSEHTAFCADVIAVSIHNLITTVISYRILYNELPENYWMDIFCWTESAMHLGIIVTVLWSVVTPLDSVNQRNPRIVQLLRAVCTKSYGREIEMFVLTFLSTIRTTLYIFLLIPGHLDSEHALNLLSNTSVLTCVVHMLPSGSRYHIRMLATFLTAGVLISMNASISWCIDQTSSNTSLIRTTTLAVRVLEMGMILVVIWNTVREHEHNYRLVLHMRQEATKQIDVTNEVMEVTKYFVHHTVPLSRYRGLIERLRDMKGCAPVSEFWMEETNVGLVFLNVTNFYTRDVEDNIVESVELLRKLFTTFEEPLLKEPFENIYSLGVRGTCQLLASGVLGDTQSESHFVTLIEYCFMALHLLTEFNEAHLNGHPGFQLSIGYHIGPVLFGFGGKHRLSYDACGETVDIAERMIHMEGSGNILVTEICRTKLGNRYIFQSYGLLSCPGGVNIPIYRCLEKDSL
ncbi:hypothetical protein P879_05318 [Paragonimus westermani]|uniref:adenylate cyclase n=1 Tax=Paragonimus westermani TaxID=34504 RepID=A0A8T0DGK1_9TREM|nr:hypothetical protein P879_05318 [Paragonimus westermani]